MVKNVLSAIVVGENFNCILFKLAFHYAETGRTIWFISPEPFTKAPAGLPVPDKEILKLVTFLYLKDYKTLLNHLHNLHSWQMTPGVIILNGYDHYTGILSDNYNTLEAALITTALVDSALTCAKKLDRTVHVITSCLKPPVEYEARIKLLSDLCFFKVISVEDENAALEDITSYLKDVTVL